MNKNEYESIRKFFQSYKNTLETFDINDICSYYEFPCTVKYYDIKQLVEKEIFQEILFELFRFYKRQFISNISVNINKIIRRKHYYKVTTNWKLFDNLQYVFLEFHYVYHIVWKDNSFKIFYIYSKNKSISKI